MLCLGVLWVVFWVAGCSLKSADQSENATSGDDRGPAKQAMMKDAPEEAQEDSAYPSSAHAAPPLDGTGEDINQRFATSKPQALRRDRPDRKATAKRRMIIYNAWLRLAVHDLPGVLERAEAKVKAMGGYVQSSSMNQRVLRVPSARYDEALAALKGFGEVRSLRTESQDITEAFTNMAARLDNLRALEARLRELLAQATTLKERLAIETELRRIEATRRELEERLAYLKDRASFATITLDVEPIDTQQATTPQRTQPFNFVRHYGLGRLMG